MSLTELERDVERYLVRKVEELGLRVYKFVPDQAPGMPDRVILLPGQRVLWVELKTEGGRLAKLQRYRHLELSKQGHNVCTVWSKDDVDALVDLIKKEKPKL